MTKEKVALVSAPLETDSAGSRRRLQDFVCWILKRISVANVRSVLEYGCGAGGLTRALGEQLGARAHVIGVDPVSKAVRTARASTDPAHYPHLEFRTVKSDSLPFREAEFDLALCVRALMHREDPQSFLREIVRVLTPGGRLLAVEIDLGGYFIADLQAFPQSVLPQLNPYIARSLAVLLTDVGLEPTDLFPNFVVSHGPLTPELLERPAAPLKPLRPRLRHLKRLDLDDYVVKVQHETAAQSRGAHATLLDVGVVARKPLAP